MSGEFDPTVELGFFPEKMFVCSSRGFLTRNDPLMDICERYIDNGRKFLNVLRRYDDLITYVLGREEASAGSAIKWSVPFLKAFGATDNGIYRWCQEHLELMPNAETTMRYITNLMPANIITSAYEHCMMPVMDRLDAAECNLTCTQMGLDQAMLGRAESRRLREIAYEIAALKVPKTVYEINVPMEVDPADIRIIKTMDAVLQDEIPSMTAMSLMETVEPVNSFKKGYSLMNMRRESNIDFNGTVIVGSEQTDFQMLDLVRDNDGLAIAFNGAEFAVRGCNVCVMSNDTTVVSVLTQEFFDGGIQSVTDLVNNWNREYLSSYDTCDRNLLDRMLDDHPRKLPEVLLVDKENVDEVSKRSDAYRRKLLGA